MKYFINCQINIKKQYNLINKQQSNPKFSCYKLTVLTDKKMGSQNSKSTSIIDSKFLKSLTASTPLKNIDQFQTEVHQIASLSPQHHQIMLQKIRIKKNYDCPYLIKIIDSHTLQSKNLCSTIIKVYIVVEKPQSLAQQIQQRIQLNLGFEQTQIWTLIYSCCMGAQYLVKNNVGLTRLNTSKIFIDLKGGIKINDPDFSQGAFNYERISQSEYIQSIAQVSRQLIRYKKLNYSKNIQQIIDIMRKPDNKLTQIQNWIRTNYLENKKQCFLVEGFSSAKKSRPQLKNKTKLRVLSGKKNSSFSIKDSKSTHAKNQLSDFTNSESLGSLKQNYEDKQNFKSNQISQKNRKVELFTFKDAMKGLENIQTQLSLQSHLFPKKALFGQRRRVDKMKDTISSQFIQLQGNIQISRSSKQQVLTRQSHSLLAETDQSLEGSQLLNMISYQVDQQTFVRQVCQEQSQYFLELMNQCKNVTKVIKQQN